MALSASRCAVPCNGGGVYYAWAGWIYLLQESPSWTLMRGQHPRHKSLFSWSVELVGCGDDSRTTWPAEAHDNDNLSQTDRGSVCAWVPVMGREMRREQVAGLNTSKCQSGLEIHGTTWLGVRQSFVDSSKLRFNQTALNWNLFSKHCLSQTWCCGFVTKHRDQSCFLQ